MSTNEVNYFGAHPRVGGSLGEDAMNEHEHIDRDKLKLKECYTRENVPRGAWVEVDLNAIAHNIRVIRKRVSTARSWQSSRRTATGTVPCM